MSKYHVGCGAFAIYAGTVNAKGDRWQNKNDVTDEAMRSVAQYIKQEMEGREQTTRIDKFKFVDGCQLCVTYELIPNGSDKGSD